MENNFIVDVSGFENGNSRQIKREFTFDIPPSYGIRGENVSVLMDGVITKADKLFLLSAACVCVVHADCSSCLADVTERISFNFTEKFSEHVDADNTEWEEIFPVSNNRIDVCDAIYANLALSIPLRFSCKPDCLGLCPVCGCNRNITLCHCLEYKKDERFEGLQKFFENR